MSPVSGSEPSHSASSGLGALSVSVCELAVAMFDGAGASLWLGENGRLNRAGATGLALNLADDFSLARRDLGPGAGLCVGDAAHDRRYGLDPALLTAGVRFYADMPLVLDGEVCGLLAIMSDMARPDFDGRHRDLLAQLAGLAAGLVRLSRQARRQDHLEATLRAALKAQTLRLERAARAARFGYWTLDLKTRDLFWSDGLYSLYGLNPKTFTPSLDGHLDIYGEDAETVLEHLRRVVTQAQDFEMTLTIVRHDDKRLRRLRLCGGIERDDNGQAARLCVVVCDIGEAVADAPRARPLSRLTEELRHPLQDILDAADSGGAVDAAAFSDALRHSAEALSRLTPETAAAVAPPVRPHDEPVMLAGLLRAVVEPFIAQARRRATRLNLHFVDWDHTRGHIDADLLEQALGPVLSQACQRTSGGVISVTASQVQAERADGALEPRLHVVVRDTGHEPADEAGLMAVKSLLARQGGYFNVKALRGEGLEVRFELPVGLAGTPPLRPRHLVPDALRPPHPTAAPARKVPPVDVRGFDREYLRSLLHDMKLGLG